MTSALTRQRHRRHANPFTVRGDVATPNWQAVYGRQAPFALDIGCGPGLFVAQLAAAHPEWDVLGLEIRQHLVDATLEEARQRGLTNVHAILANASGHLGTLLPERSVAFVAVNFPDPWYKKRHHKRRVVSPPWLTSLAQKLLPGARLHAMTDYEPIAQQMRDVLDGQPGYNNLDTSGGYAAQSTTGLTSEREIKHLRRGEPIYRLQYVFEG